MTDKDNLTPSQRAAVVERGGNILVSASAGSGKTKIMIERIIDLVINGETDVDRILAVTYTNASAADMKKKLVKRIKKAITGGKDPERLRLSLEKVQYADVSTFDSYCANLLRSEFFAIGLDPSFKVADDNDSAELKQSAIDDLFRELYEKRDEGFLRLVRFYRSGRSDGALKQLVLDLYSFSATEQDQKGFLEKCAESVNEKTYEEYKNGLLSVYREMLKSVKTDFEESAAECSGTEKLAAAAKSAYSKYLAALSAKTLPDLISVAALPCEKFPNANKNGDPYVEEIKATVKGIVKTVNGIYDEIAVSMQGLTDEECKARYLSTAETVSALARTTLAFEEKFSALKRRENVADFGDLERLAYKLLSENPDVLSSVREKYDFVFADEYQDVNGLQEAILSLISKDNAFMVGDVKQSIYAFRGCNPAIFAAKYKDYAAGKGKAFSLDCNFRSSDGVLKAVNNVFSGVMTEEFGGTDYASNPMVRGGIFPENYGSATVHVLTETKEKTEPPAGVYDLIADSDKEDDRFEEGEGLLIAKIIRDEVNDNKIYGVDKDGNRILKDVRYSDIAVLVRANTEKISKLIKTLLRADIPVSSETETPIENFPEIRLLIDILELIAFYADDVPLASVLLSPIGKLTNSDLAEIRRHTPRKRRDNSTTFLGAVKAYEESGENREIREKLAAFEKYFEKIRLLSEFTGAGELLARIITENGLDLEAAGKTRGAQRLARMERFIAESERDGKKLTVNEFLARLETALKNVAMSETGTENSVKVMTMHSSKGLEFPIVILADIDKTFSSQDVRVEMMKERSLGIAVKAFDEESMSSLETISRTYFREKLRLNAITEEARLFYVAMTRAEDRLHLVTTTPVEQKKKKVILARKIQDFVCAADMSVAEYREEDVAAEYEEREVRTVYVGKGRDSLTKKILGNLSFSYPYAADTTTPLKSAVTRIVAEESAPLYPTFPEETEKSYRGDFAERGTAYHRFLELHDFSRSDAERELKEFLEKGLVSKSQIALLDVKLLEKIITLPVFSELKDFSLYREQPFIAPFSSSEVYGKDGGEILVQGVIDLLAVSKDGKDAVIVDYKMSGKDAETLKRVYSSQLSLYKAAVKRSLPIENVKTVLLNVRTGEQIELTVNI